jgi:hypothetical protein
MCRFPRSPPNAFSQHSLWQVSSNSFNEYERRKSPVSEFVAAVAGLLSVHRRSPLSTIDPELTAATGGYREA